MGRGQGVGVFVGWVDLGGHWCWNGLAVEKRVVAMAKWIVGICAVEAGQWAAGQWAWAASALIQHVEAFPSIRPRFSAGLKCSVAHMIRALLDADAGRKRANALMIRALLDADAESQLTMTPRQPAMPPPSRLLQALGQQQRDSFAFMPTAPARPKDRRGAATPSSDTEMPIPSDPPGSTSEGSDLPAAFADGADDDDGRDTARQVGRQVGRYGR